MKILQQKLNFNNNTGVKCLAWLGFMLFMGDAAATAQTIGDMASSITGSFLQIAKLITAGSYLAGLGFSISAIMKFKAHKDNPTQISVGVPISMTFIASSLLFLPTILGLTGFTMFSSAGTVAGPTGIEFRSGGVGF